MPNKSWIVALVLAAPLVASAKYPTFYSAQVVDDCGEPLTGQRYVSLAIYDQQIGGDPICGDDPTAGLYQHDDQLLVDLVYGHLSLEIPGCYSYLELEESNNVWIELTVNSLDGGDKLVFPRQRVGSVPQAGGARRAVGTLKTELSYRWSKQNQLRNYTTTSTQTGKAWIDGRPIYRSHIPYIPATGQQTKWYLDFDYIVDIHITLFVSGPTPNSSANEGNYPFTRAGQVLGGSWHAGTNDIAWEAVPGAVQSAAGTDDSYLWLKAQNWSGRYFGGWVEYTKVTDPPCSAADIYWDCDPAQFPPALEQ